MKRLLYLAYYLRRMNWPLLKRFMAHESARQGTPSVLQAWQCLLDSLRYNVSPLEVYQFGFFGMSPAEKARWAGTGTLYEFQRRTNPPSARGILDDKRRFYEAYRSFFRHSLYTRETLAQDSTLLPLLLTSHAQLVLKVANGKCGAQVKFVGTEGLTPQALLDRMVREGLDLLETPITQHPALNALSPSGVNTVRIFTLLGPLGTVKILGCRLRISVNSPVDNLAAGNLAAPIDEQTGVVTGPGVYSDITKAPEANHPVTGTPIVGFAVPYWQDCLKLARVAALRHPQNRSIGWDIAVTPEGPGLIEGNHDWCKLVWQLPVNKGLKALLETRA